MIEYKCTYCDRDFSGSKNPWEAKNAHLRFCKQRILSRYLKFQGYLFVIRGNPQRKIFHAIGDMFAKNGEDITADGIAIILTFLKEKKDILDFAVVELFSPLFLKFRNGWVGYNKLLEMLVPEEQKKIFGEVKPVVAASTT